ncbi:VCBS repeat-containing protein [Anabaena aphanizomenioides LEGE 00250]|uniref:VCBS repeat-containing protein n=1 Tax=Sphaerospermopsis aphanizomenoides LEGE 00250 TaxID=2777972 RepID=A0ABR9VKP6_9CYAN|nr:FG-GAP-like repeat-containing protein [Sphaerospermopsis aphanizomenoides]MBE9238217.1 VCBS repeat-containing protein [Sphaerospermopsis aphanizomenoides LEGE 00250]
MQQTDTANPFNGIDVGYYSAPTFADLDGDKDLDAVVGAKNGTLLYYRNTGTATNPFYVELTDTANPFDGIDVGFSSVPTFADLDGDKDLDAVVGASDGTLSYLLNTGTATNPVYEQQTDTANPFNGINVGSSSAPTFADLDGDGDLDAVVGAMDGTLSYLLNTDTTPKPISFSTTPSTPNPFNGINVGSFSAPTFADLDGDGDLDAVVGAKDGTLRYYRNTGTATNPAYVQQTSTANPFNSINVGFNSAPTFADLDGDKDLDAVVGADDGKLLYYRNTGTATNPVYVEQPDTANPFNGIGVGFASAPTFADLDGDGDLDAVVGALDGTLRFFENAPIVTIAVGSNASEPSTAGSFTLTLSQLAPAGGITVSYTLGGTATSGTDYENLPGTVTFAPGATSATVTITPTADVLAEGTETVILTLVDQPGYNLSTTPIATLNIADEVINAAPTAGTPNSDQLISPRDLDGIKDIVFTGAGNDEVDIPSGGSLTGDNRIFTGSGDDVIFVSNGDRAFGGSSDDELDATDATDYRLSGGAGIDTFYLGADGRALGGDGNDIFYVQEGGGNLISGGAGADEFWILTGDLPATANTILDFTIGTDVLGIGGQGVNFGFDDLIRSGNNIAIGSQTIATLKNVDTTKLTANHFTFD